MQKFYIILTGLLHLWIDMKRTSGEFSLDMKKSKTEFKSKMVSYSKLRCKMYQLMYHIIAWDS